MRFRDSESSSLAPANKKLYLFALSAAFGLASLFCISAYFASQYDRFPGDLAFSQTIQSVDAPWLESVAIAISIEENKVIIFSLMVLASVAVYLLRWKRESIVLLTTTVSGAIIVEITKALIARPRPTEDLVQVLQNSSSYSYPSGNAGLYGLFFIALALAVTSRAVDRKRTVAIWATTVVVLAFVGICRVYLGAHWLSDILSAYVLALAWALLTTWLIVTLETGRTKQTSAG